MKQIITILLLFCPICMIGQTLSVSDFYLDEHDLTAINEATKFVDDNGDICALIKVETTEKGFYFDGGTVGVAKVDDNHHSEIWVYVPAGLRRITISHNKLGMLRNYEFPIALQMGRTYVMKLISGSVETVVSQKRTSQVFVLKFTPITALVEIDGTMVETEDGTYSGVLPFGKHEYRITAKNYHSEVGKVEIGEEKKIVNVKLRPAYGWIEIKGPNGASVFIDGEKVGIAPFVSTPVASGNHDVRVVKDKYLPHREQVIVNDNTTTTINPRLTANFVTVNLITGKDAEIWVNGEKKGKGNVSVDLVPGEYSFETKLQSHRSQSIVRNITMASGGTIDLPSPIAITGSIMINVKPVGATVTVDGKPSGETPVILDNVLIGSHEIVVKKDGCVEHREKIMVTEGQTSSVEGRLLEGKNVILSCGVHTAHWFVDGADYGTGAEIVVNLSYSEHRVSIKAVEYKDFTEYFIVNANVSKKTFVIQKLVKDEELITVNGVTFKMCLVEGGTFTMGRNNGSSIEKPAHSVTLSNYFIGETEVTQDLWKAVMGYNPSYRKSDRLPVEQVSWNDCQAFISKLNKLTGRTFALPTEAQWEFAARGGNKSQSFLYPGSDNINRVAWYTDNCESQTHTVATKQANELGVYDMSGNVCEWCFDWYGPYNSSPETEPTGDSSGKHRINRGGSWYNIAEMCDVFNRSWNTPDNSSMFCGFRLVLLR